MAVSVRVSNVGDIPASCVVSLSASAAGGQYSPVGSSAVETIIPGGSRTLMLTYRPPAGNITLKAELGQFEPYETDDYGDVFTASIEVEAKQQKAEEKTLDLPGFGWAILALAVLSCATSKRHKRK